MNPSGRKSPKRAANDLSVLLRAVFGKERFPVDVEALAREVSNNNEDPIATIRGVDIPGFEGMLHARRRRNPAGTSSTALSHAIVDVSASPLRTSSAITCSTVTR